ncbi:MAG: hypothetical protein N2444_10900, partial [Methylocystis sp.]|nr:hypothetical protein [Methylocystis sp.]
MQGGKLIDGVRQESGAAVLSMPGLISSLPDPQGRARAIVRFRMKKSLLIATALATIAGSAIAADLPSYKSPPPPPPPPPPMWTGFYVGLNAGYTWSNSNWTQTTSFPIFGNAGLGCGVIGQCPLSAALSQNSIVSVRDDGFIGGGQIGYNWQFSPSIVVGVEADIQGIAGSTNSASAVTIGDDPGLPELYV